ncbi:MAG: hypothetical protein ACKOFD_08115 [Actinomycetota bacterium]
MAGNPLNDPDLATKVVDVIDGVVSYIRDHTTRPLVKSARGLVFGLLATFGVFAIIIRFAIVVSRAVQSLLDVFMSRDAAEWLSYSIASAVFLLVGTILMRRRHVKE